MGSVGTVESNKTSALKRLNALSDKGGGAVATPLPLIPKSEGWKLQDIWQKVKASARKKLPVEEVDVSNIYTWQTWVQKSGIEKLINNEAPEPSSDLPMAIYADGKYVLMDGNHRVAAGLLSGQKKFQIRVYRRE